MPKNGVLSILLARVVSTKMQKVAKCEVNRLKLDDYVMKYYSKRRTVFARDSERIAKVGDIVLLKELPAKVSTRVSHRVDRIIYGIGDATDPITGLKCDKDGYWESYPGELEASVAERLKAETAARTESVSPDGTPV